MFDTMLRVASLTILIYFITLILSRFLGRKLLFQMTFFDFVIGIMIGTAAVNASVVETNRTLSNFTILIIISLLTLILDFLHIKSMWLRKVINSEPVTIIENGKIIDENMKHTRLTSDELMMMLREKNVFYVGDVEFAILETNGKLSVQLCSQMQPVTPADLNISTDYKGLTRDLVIDGKIIMDNLRYIKLDKKWLMNQIRAYGIYDLKDVYYAGIDTAGNLYISKCKSESEEPGKQAV